MTATGTLPLLIAVVVDVAAIWVTTQAVYDAVQDVKAIRSLPDQNGRVIVARMNLRSQLFRLATLVVLMVAAIFTAFGANDAATPTLLLLARWTVLFAHVLIAASAWLSSRDRGRLYR